jgi:hypothetical protein
LLREVPVGVGEIATTCGLAAADAATDASADVAPAAVAAACAAVAVVVAPVIAARASAVAATRAAAERERPRAQLRRCKRVIAILLSSERYFCGRAACPERRYASKEEFIYMNAGYVGELMSR